MKNKLKSFQTRLVWVLALGIGPALGLAAEAGDSADAAPAKTSIPWSQIGAKAAADYQGDGLVVSPTAEGARLRCIFQRLEGEATREGLWLTSTVTNGLSDRFRVVAVAVGRQAPILGDEVTSLTSNSSTHREHASDRMEKRQRTAALQNASRNPGEVRIPTGLGVRLSSAALAVGDTLRGVGNRGTVAIEGQNVHFTRPGVVEEYSMSMDGLRQDFVVLERPSGAGELAVRLAVSGAKVESATGGAQLVLEGSGRKIAYSRLRVTDATGKELTARMEALTPALSHPMGEGEYPPSLLVLVNDADAVYPIRIDPTFSDANWISMGGIPGADRSVSAAVVDGAGNLYIGGYFTVIGDVIANGIAKWNGSSWSALGSGIQGNGGVLALAVSGSNVYAGGAFTNAGGVAATNIAKWNGTSWSALGSGTSGGIYSGDVYALAVSGSNLYAGGSFTTAGGGAANSIAKWNGSSWTNLGSGMSDHVYALAVSGSDLYAGGGFSTAGGSAANNIAKWNGSSWSDLGSGTSGTVFALAVSGSDLYAAEGNSVGKWDGSSWTALGSGVGGGDFQRVYALAVSGGDLYAGGDFTTADGVAASAIAKWNGSNWSALGAGLLDAPRGTFPYVYVFALAASGSNVYVGGWFTTAGGGTANFIARWNGSSWSALGSGMGMNNEVRALTVLGSDVHAGGNFTTAGGSVANYTAKWNGTSWSALGSGIGGYPYATYVYALAVSGSNVYAGGYFTTAGGSAATNIAKWNGSSWTPLGSGMNSGVYALAVSGSDAYAGGNFTTAGGSGANYIAKWDGTSWSPLGSGMNNQVNALAVSGSDLYAGGYFTTAGGNAANHIAKWNGSSWSALDSGVFGGDYPLYGSVSTLAVAGTNLYAGGSFTTAGNSAATNVARWNGSSWSALGPGIGFAGDAVYALAVSGSDVYAGGYFTFAGGSRAANIAKWNGSSWTALSSGIGGGFVNGDPPSVLALAVLGSDLYAGGYFTTAGGKVSGFLAKAIVNPPVLAIQGDGDGGYFIRFSGVPGSAYRLERAPGLTGPWEESAPQTAPASGFLEFWDLFPPLSQGFYRSVQP
jgi:hypothetical protein